MHGFLSNFGCCFPWAIRGDIFFQLFFGFFFYYFFYEYLSFSLAWDPSKRYSSYQSQSKVFKRFLNFLPNGPHKTTFGIFEIFSFRSLTIFFFENFKFTIAAYIWRNKKTSIIWRTSARGAKRSEIWDS